MHGKVLIVDDEPRICRSLAILLGEEGPYQTVTAHDYYEALEKLTSEVTLVLTDLNMPGKGGLDLLRDVRERMPDIPIILMTAYSTVESAVTAMKEGATDYIQKPFDNDALVTLVRRYWKPKSGREYPPAATQDSLGYGDLLGQSACMREVYYRIRRAAEADSTVLITGESGTGKELAAKAIHFAGNRKSKQFITLNCAAVPENLLESELFGHERGAFSGAIQTREGKFELAHTGTLFLDEIGEMTSSLQVKLLRVLQDKIFERVGGQESKQVDVRIIAATNRDLSKAIAEGFFREDLFYRLNVITIDMPALRRRKEDLPNLIEHFLLAKSRKLGLSKRTLSQEAMAWLLQYDYPGNVRELENMIERAVVISRDPVISLREFPTEGSLANTSSSDLGEIPLQGGLRNIEALSASLERRIIVQAIQAYPTKTNAELASLLGTSRRVLESRMKKYGVIKAT